VEFVSVLFTCCNLRLFIELDLTKSIKYFRESREDAKRTWMTKEELCGFLWNFRFKKATGPGWVEDDPWWLGKPPRQVRFLEDGLVKWESDGGDNEDEDDSSLSEWKKRREGSTWHFADKAAGRTGPTG